MTTRPREHPDADLLADLAADVLPEDLARRVESHVLDCDRCAELMAEAEGVRGLLRRQPPPTMPADVADRIGTALAGLRLGPAAGDRAGLEDDAEADARWAAAAERGAVGAVRGRREAPEPSGWAARRTAEHGSEARVRRLRRAATGPARPRRQSIDEQRSAERAGRVGRVLLAAAAAVVFVAAGGFAVRLLDDGITGGATAISSGDSGDSGAGGGESAASAPEAAQDSAESGKAYSTAAGVVVLATGTDYTDAALVAQTRVLVAAASAPLAGSGQGDGAATASPAPPTTPQAATGADQRVRQFSGNQTLLTPAALDGCLRELDATRDEVVAIDLARYQGRESAVIVLRGTGGKLDVWIVARDCKPGADGTLKYVAVTP
jgi:hypothetical protein